MRCIPGWRRSDDRRGSLDRRRARARRGPEGDDGPAVDFARLHEAVEGMAIDAAADRAGGAPGHEPRVAMSSSSRGSPWPPPRCSRSSRSPSSSSWSHRPPRWGRRPIPRAGARRAALPTGRRSDERTIGAWVDGSNAWTVDDVGGLRMTTDGALTWSEPRPVPDPARRDSSSSSAARIDDVGGTPRRGGPARGLSHLRRRAHQAADDDRDGSQRPRRDPSRRSTSATRRTRSRRRRPSSSHRSRSSAVAGSSRTTTGRRDGADKRAVLHLRVLGRGDPARAARGRRDTRPRRRPTAAARGSRPPAGDGRRGRVLAVRRRPRRG